MIDINNFLDRFLKELYIVFPSRILFFGLQGSYGRGEATESSDIDVVVIFDTLSGEDLLLYRSVLDKMEEKDLICGFVSSYEELKSWQRIDLLSLVLDTKPIKGRLNFSFSKAEIKEAVLTAVCGIYHMASHNFLHAKSKDALVSIKKNLLFALRLKYYFENSEYIPSMTKLLEKLEDRDKEVAQLDFDDFDDTSLCIIKWASSVLINHND